jgi:hypothetical protein
MVDVQGKNFVSTVFEQVIDPFHLVGVWLTRFHVDLPGGMNAQELAIGPH